MAEAEHLVPVDSEDFALAECERGGSMQRSFEPPQAPHPLEISQPVAVYFGWLLIGVIALSYALLFPVGSLIEEIARALPRWSQVAGVGAAAALVLAAIERTKRDRKPLGYTLTAAAAVLAGLAVPEGLLVGRATQPGWYAVLAGLLYGLVHLLWIDDWVQGRSGPRFQHLSAAVRDLATVRWWYWSSKAALVRREQRLRRESELRDRREREEADRRSAENAAATAAAEQQSKERTLAAMRLAEEAARVERVAANEQRRADEARLQATAAEEKRATAELRVATARREIEELRHQAEAAALDQVRLKAEQMEAERHFLDAALAARSAAEKALEHGAAAERAQELLERVCTELSLVGDAEPARARDDSSLRSAGAAGF